MPNTSASPKKVAPLGQDAGDRHPCALQHHSEEDDEIAVVLYE
jgi:hypothetical protein